MNTAGASAREPELCPICYENAFEKHENNENHGESSFLGYTVKPDCSCASYYHAICFMNLHDHAKKVEHKYDISQLPPDLVRDIRSHGFTGRTLNDVPKVESLICPTGRHTVSSYMVYDEKNQEVGAILPFSNLKNELKKQVPNDRESMETEVYINNVFERRIPMDKLMIKDGQYIFDSGGKRYQVSFADVQKKMLSFLK